MELERLLDDVQAILELDGRWTSSPPAEERLNSSVPFCMDTLEFTEWLQWIYVARLRALIEANSPLPKGALVKPYAEEAMRVANYDSPDLLILIEAIDKQLA